MTSRLAVLLFLTASMGFAACSPSDAPVDAAIDAGRDARLPMPDLGPPCELACSGGARCCNTPDAGQMCRDLVNDPESCGECGTVCAEGRGTRCAFGTCVCGLQVRGCAGTRRSWCCPPRPGTADDYCANLDTNTDDCGACNTHCEAAKSDGCSGGQCVCGRLGRECAGTPEARCCFDGSSSACIDTTRSATNCGACGRQCGSRETCCGGVCCEAVRCMGGVCLGVDAGASDAGARDGGTVDTGAADAAFDAAPADAGTQSDTGVDGQTDEPG